MSGRLPVGVTPAGDAAQHLRQGRQAAHPAPGPHHQVLIPLTLLWVGMIALIGIAAETASVMVIYP
ncbi:MAG TPA: hypothetical protein VEZ71_21285, partial [Archangium sp.]|nr:hypothetical protein [Archangium sp.]